MLFFCLLIVNQTWTETTQSDFRDGQYEVNIYSSPRLGGTVEFTSRFDLNNDGYIDLFLSNPSAISICWGSASGYSNSNKYTFSSNGSGNCSCGDLNCDGWPDFIVSHGNSGARMAIYWGSAAGFNPGNSTSLATVSNEVSYNADLNRDGYQDIIGGTTLNDNTGSIWWGSASGYTNGNRTDLPTGYGAHNTEVADLNRDGYYDIIFVNNSAASNYIYWGSATGYSSGNMTPLSAPSGTPHGATVADFNADGFLDLVFTSVSSSASYVYYGSASGYGSHQSLNTSSTYGGSSACDINRDGFLDLVFIRGSQPSVIYWGSATGFSDTNILVFGSALYATGGFVADLNYDGSYDVYIDNRGGDSPVYWGPNYTSSFIFTGDGDHHTMYREVGNAYHRKYYEDYISSVYDAGQLTAWGVIDWDDSLPQGSRVSLFVRSGDTPVPDLSWSGWDSLAKGADIPDSLNSRYLQYRCRLGFTNPAYLPYLYEVRIGIGPRLILEPDQADSTLPAIPVDYPVSVIDFDIGLDTIDLDYRHNTSWPVDLLDSTGTLPLVDHNSNGLVDVIMDSGDTLPITVRITPPAGAVGGTVDSMVVRGQSNAMPTLKDSVFLRTTIIRLIQILVDPDQSDTVAPGVTASYGMDVINLGTNLDTIDLYYHHNQPWGVALLDSTGSVPLADHNSNGFPDVIVVGGAICPIVLDVYTPGAAIPGTIDSLVLTGRSSLNHSVTDSAQVKTVIDLVSTIIVDPNQAGNTFPGVEIRYDLYVMKFGPGTDTVDLSYRHGQAWPVVLFDSSSVDTLIDHNQNGVPDVIAAPDDSVAVILGITPPGSTPAGTVDTLYLIGASDILPGIRDSARVITTIEALGSLIVYPDQVGSGSPGTWVTFNLTCRNNQILTDTVDFRTRDLMGFTRQLRDSLNNILTDHNGNGLPDIPAIPALGGEADFRLQVFIPSNAPGNRTDSIVITGYSGADSLVRDSALVRLNINQLIQVRIDPDRYDSCDAGDSLNYALYVQNLGNAADVIDLQTMAGGFTYSLRDINGNPLTDTDSDGLLDVGSLLPFEGESIMVRVRVPSTAVGVEDTVYVRASSSLNPVISDQAMIRTRVSGGIWGLIIEPDQEDRVGLGEAVVYQVQATLQASMADVVELDQSGVAQDWQAELLDQDNDPLVDTDADGYVDLGPVSPMVARGFRVRVTAPDHFNFEGEVDTVPALVLVVYGHSHRQTAIRDSAILRTRLAPPFEVHNFRNPFRDRTRFMISLPKDGRVTLEVYNRAGEMVCRLLDSQWLSCGIHYLPWDGRNARNKELAPGTYLYVLDFTADDGERLSARKKAVRLK